MKRVVLIAALVCFGMASAFATSTTLAPGGSVAVPTTSLTGAWSVVADTGLTAFGGSTSPNGNFESWVIAGNTDNPYGGLTFAYYFELNSTTPNDVGRVTMSDYTGWLTDVAQLSNGNSSPASADRSPYGDVVGFQFAPTNTVLAGGASNVLLIYTNALFYHAGDYSIIDSHTQTVTAFAPAVPEPASFALFGSGLIGLAGLFRRRLQK